MYLTRICRRQFPRGSTLTHGASSLYQCRSSQASAHAMRLFHREWTSLNKNIVDNFPGVRNLYPVTRCFSALSESPIDTSQSETRGLVVLVHGFLGHRVQFLPLASLLARRKYDVLNFGYASRAHCLHDHAKILADTVRHRVSRDAPHAVHFVCHSFGGVVLRAAMKEQCLGTEHTKTVLIGPPARGCAFARLFVTADFAHEQLRPMIRRTAEFVLGAASGRELLHMTPEWFLAQGGSQLPGKALVIAGNVDRRINPFILDDNDGVIAISETVLPFKHYRLEESLTHNMLLYSPRVIVKIGDFLDGHCVGTMFDGGL